MIAIALNNTWICYCRLLCEGLAILKAGCKYVNKEDKTNSYLMEPYNFILEASLNIFLPHIPTWLKPSNLPVSLFISTGLVKES